MIPVIVLNLVTSIGRRDKIAAALASFGIAHRFLFGRLSVRPSVRSR